MNVTSNLEIKEQSISPLNYMNFDYDMGLRRLTQLLTTPTLAIELFIYKTREE